MKRLLFIVLTLLFPLIVMAQKVKDPSIETYTVNGVSYNMIRIEGGSFMMGATSEMLEGAKSDEEPVHQVTLSDYCIGETEVTQVL